MKTETRKLKQLLKYKIPQVRLALIKEPAPKSLQIFTPVDIEQFVEPMKYYDTEHCISFHLDGKHNVIGYHIVSQGTLTSSLLHPRETFKAAILNNSYTILLAHNHPSGSLAPSDCDLQITKQMAVAGNIIGVPLLDHVVVSVNGVTSIRQLYPELFKQGEFQ